MSDLDAIHGRHGYRVRRDLLVDQLARDRPELAARRYRVLNATSRRTVPLAEAASGTVAVELLVSNASLPLDEATTVVGLLHAPGDRANVEARGPVIRPTTIIVERTA